MWRRQFLHHCTNVIIVYGFGRCCATAPIACIHITPTPSNVTQNCIAQPQILPNLHHKVDRTSTFPSL